MQYVTDTIELKKTMIDNGYSTNTQLSIAAGIDRNTLGSVLSGKTQPSSNVMYKLVDALHLKSEQAGKIFFKHNLHNT